MFLLTEGGLGGHMNHPHEVMDPKDLLDFIEKLFSGDLVGTEKVDGVNIYLGLNDSKELVFARNKTEDPFKDASEKFTTSHPAWDIFDAGLKALTEGFSKLSDTELEAFTLLREGQPNNFINAEIIYGEVPNIIPYSKIKNFIVFHTFSGRKEGGYAEPDINSEIDISKLLNKLANRLGELEIESTVVKFFGSPGGVKKETSKEKSTWEFKGPIGVKLDSVKSQLDDLLADIKSNRRWQELNKHVAGYEKLTDIQVKAVSKELVALAGSKILATLRSALSDPDIKIATGHPGIEGIVMKTQTGEGDTLQNHLIKITGDFAQLNQDVWEYLKDTIPAIKQTFTNASLEEAFGIKRLSSLTNRSFRKYAGAGETKQSIVKAFLADRSSKYDRAEFLLDEPDINVFNIVDRYANKAIKDLSKVWTDVQDNPDKPGIKLEETKRAILIAAHQFETFKKSISSDDTVVTLFLKMLQSLFYIKFVRTTQGVIESYRLDEYDYAKEEQRTTGVFVGKFDPAHIGHMGLINEMLHENDNVIIFISKKMNTLDYKIKEKILKKYVDDSGQAAKIEIYPMTAGFIPALLLENISEEIIKNTKFTIYAGSDRANSYKKQFTGMTKDGIAYWQYIMPDFDVIERDNTKKLKMDDILSLTRIPIKLSSSTLMRQLAKHGSPDAYRVFANSQPTKDKKFILYVWTELKKAQGVNYGRQETDTERRHRDDDTSEQER